MSDEKVVSLNGGPVPQPGAPSESLIEFFEEQLERARTGEVVGFAGAVLHSDQEAEYWVVGLAGGFSMVGALQCALSRLTEVARGD